MVRMTGTSDKVGPKVLMDEWLRAKPDPSLFVEHEFQIVEQEKTDSLNILLRQVVHQLISAKWELLCKQEQR